MSGVIVFVCCLLHQSIFVCLFLGCDGVTYATLDSVGCHVTRLSPMAFAHYTQWTENTVPLLFLDNFRYCWPTFIIPFVISIKKWQRLGSRLSNGPGEIGCLRCYLLVLQTVFTLTKDRRTLGVYCWIMRIQVFLLIYFDFTADVFAHKFFYSVRVNR